MATTTTDRRRLITVELERLEPNPWQPRGSLDPNHTRELADSIAQVGLLQAPLVRIVGQTYQIAFGHYRVEALKLLERSFAEVEIRGLTDEQMAVIALSENSKRKDVPPIEQYRAWAKALDIEGMTVQRLADTLGLDRSTVSNNLRILRLPAYVLEWVDNGELSAHGAREFLAYMGDDGHFHDKEAHQVLTVLTSGAPDWRVVRIRSLVQRFVESAMVADWRPLEGQYARGSLPNFDVDQFKRDQAARVHTIPNDEVVYGAWENGAQPIKSAKERSRAWTCATASWVARQNAVKAAAAKTAAPQETPANIEAPRTANFARQLAQDPVFQRLVSQETADGEKAPKPSGLSDEQKEQMGTRATPVLLERRGTFKAVVDKRDVQTYDTNAQKPPTYFPDIEECRQTCTIGAVWAHFTETQPLYQFCVNKEHYQEKVAAGRERVTQKFADYMEKVDAREADLYALIEGAGWHLPPAMARLLAATVLPWRIEPIEPEGMPWDEKRDLARYTANTERLVALLGKDDRRAQRDDYEAAMALNAILKSEVPQEILNRLLVLNAGSRVRGGELLLIPFIEALRTQSVVPREEETNDLDTQPKRGPGRPRKVTA